MKKILLVTLILFGTLVSRAQYKVGIGGAIGDPTGLSLKIFSQKDMAFDFTMGWWHNYINFTGIYEIHFPLSSQLKFYLGPGAHIGSGKGSYQDGGLFIGVDGALGAEWKGEAPVAVAFDFRPRVDIGANTSFYPSAQLALRYTIGRYRYETRR